MDSKREEHHSHLPLRERWLMAGLAGNSMWPQYGTFITLAQAAEMFQFEPGEIVGIAMSSFSKAEIEKAEAVMISQHIKHGVSKEVNDKIIIGESTEKLLETEREVSVRFLFAFLSRLQRPTQVPQLAGKPSTCANDLEIFLRNVENRDTVMLGRKLLQIASRILQTSKDSSEQHKQWIKGEYPLMHEAKLRGESPLSLSDRISIGSSKGHNATYESILDAWVNAIGNTYSRRFLEQLMDVG